LYSETVIAQKEKCITVYDKNGKRLAACTKKRAEKLVARQSAYWIGENQIKLLVNQNDRKKMRKEIIAEANRTCYICGVYIPENEYPTLDHVVARAQYGVEAKKNLKCCCKRCNNDKADKPLIEYVEHIKGHVEAYPWISPERLILLEELAKNLNG
jgi:hypothetical protein